MRRSGLAALPEVLFDVDGVLVHPWRFRDHLAREYGIGPAETQAFFRGPFTRCVVGDADLHEELAPFLELWGWRDSVESSDLRFFARAQQGVGRPASEMILVDDSLANVAAAREAGWQAVHYIAPESLDGLWRMIGLPITRFDP